jgi:hypothetical protein
VWMHSLCIFDHAFLPHPKSFFVQIFSSNSYGCLLSTHEIFLSLRSGSKIKISKKLELSRLPKTKKISLSTVGIFHIYFFSHGKIRLEVTYNSMEVDFSNSDILGSF